MLAVDRSVFVGLRFFRRMVVEDNFIFGLAVMGRNLCNRGVDGGSKRRPEPKKVGRSKPRRFLTGNGV
jgi:hypothetical protein